MYRDTQIREEPGLEGSWSLDLWRGFTVSAGVLQAFLRIRRNSLERLPYRGLAEYPEARWKRLSHMDHP